VYRSLRPLLFRLDPETAHRLTLGLLRLAGRLPPWLWVLQAMFSVPGKPVQAFGLKFKNPVGLAAGYDKDGIAIQGLAALGFGHIEIGTVTPRPQSGNPRPRVFRLVEDEAVINRMGFPGKGMSKVASQMSSVVRRPSSIILGVNLGKNKDTPLEESTNDYISLVRTFSPLADYLAINVSSPNTIGLRRLQGRAMLEELLKAVNETRTSLPVPRPMLVKLAPDLSNNELDDAIDVILYAGMDGVILTNTTLERAGLHSCHQGETGGLSGAPLRGRSELVLSQVLKRLDGHLPVVSVGGIMSAEDAKRRLDMGAALVQVYTGLVYAGPGLVQKIIKAV